MYGVLSAIEKSEMPAKAGFVHVPYIPAQVAAKGTQSASMALADIVKGLTAGIGALDERLHMQQNGVER